MDNLPEPILIEIFKFFEDIELKILTNVCKRWSSIIKSSNFLSRQSAISIETRKNSQTLIRSSIFQKSFNFHISGLPNDEIILREVVSAHQETLEHVTLEKLKNISAVQFTDLLKLFDNIQSLTLADGAVEEREIHEKIHWKNLKYLKMKEFDCDIAKYFENAQFKKIKLVGLKSDTVNSDRDFWVQQSKTLEELRILKCPVCFDSILTVINAGILRKLQLNIKLLTQNLKQLLDALEMYKFVKITFKGLNDQSSTIESVISNDSSVTKLKFVNSSFDFNSEIIPCIHKSLPNLTHLRLPLNYGKIPSESRIYFENLKYLEFEAIKYQAHVNRLIYILQKSPNLRILKINWIGKHAVSHDLFIKVLRNTKHAEYLHFGSKFDSFELSDEIVEIIGENCSENLRKLTIFTGDVEIMRKKLEKLSHKNIKCFVWDKNQNGITADDDRFSKFLTTNENKTTSSGKFIATCTWSR